MRFKVGRVGRAELFPAMPFRRCQKISARTVLEDYAAFWILPFLIQEVQTRMRLGAPLTMARTGCRFTFQRRLVILWAWLTLLPNMGPRPQTSHTFAIS